MAISDAVKCPDTYEDASISPPGVTSEREMFDVFVTMAVTPHNFVPERSKTDNCRQKDIKESYQKVGFKEKR
ncbi:hypothetical protein CEXT_119241 [Caerostris extrusa]|uniref:Uncharacterized protein n=1 Tax=Caerostris extrusa TaxID=172846 RepID=A0AAV4XNI6_CAEEX|nr:hypothetical protein CEXT_119241 [Caerostris extrusa]